MSLALTLSFRPSRRTLPCSTVVTPSFSATDRGSWFLPLNENDEELAITLRPGTCPSRSSTSTARPSEKYACSGLPLRFSKGRTAIAGFAGGFGLPMSDVLLITVAVLLVRQSDIGKPPPPASPAIAVLPFENLSGNPEQEYFSDGLAVEVLDRLGRVPGLRVIASSSSFSFKGKNQDPRPSPSSSV